MYLRPLQILKRSAMISIGTNPVVVVKVDKVAYLSVVADRVCEYVMSWRVTRHESCLDLISKMNS